MITVVIPADNAQSSLPRCFESLMQATLCGLVCEVIVADAGSTDGTAKIADAMGAHFMTARGGLGRQLHAGAGAARFDWILFLPADTALEPGWESEAKAFITTASLDRPCAATFRFALEQFGPAARWTERVAAVRTRLFAHPYGNQGLLIPKRFYRQLGGYRDVPLEDVDLVRRIGRKRLVPLRSRALNTGHCPAANSRELARALLCALRVPTHVLARLN